MDMDTRKHITANKAFAWFLLCIPFQTPPSFFAAALLKSPLGINVSVLVAPGGNTPPVHPYTQRVYKASYTTQRPGVRCKLAFHLSGF